MTTNLTFTVDLLTSFFHSFIHSFIQSFYALFIPVDRWPAAAYCDVLSTKDWHGIVYGDKIEI